MCTEIKTEIVPHSAGKFARRILNSAVIRSLCELSRKKFCNSSREQVQCKNVNHAISDSAELIKSVSKVRRPGLQSLLGVPVLTIIATLFTLEFADVNAQEWRMRIGWLDDNGVALSDYKPARADFDGLERYAGYEKHLPYSGRGGLPNISGLTAIPNSDSTFSQQYTASERVYRETEDLFNPDLWDVDFDGKADCKPQGHADFDPYCFPERQPLIGPEINSDSVLTLRNAATNNPFDFVPAGNTGKVIDANKPYYTIGENFKYGTWYVQHTRYNHCSRLHRGPDAFCRHFFFDPNEAEIAKLTSSEVVRARLLVEYGDAEQDPARNLSRHLIIRLTGNSRLTVAWTDGTRGIVDNLGPFGDYPDLEGIVTIDSLQVGQATFEPSAERGPQEIGKSCLGSPDCLRYWETDSLKLEDVIPTQADGSFEGNEAIISDGLRYGQWILEKEGRHPGGGAVEYKVRYRPNNTEVATIPSGHEVLSNLQLHFHNVRNYMASWIRGAAVVPVISVPNTRQTVGENVGSSPARFLISTTQVPASNRLNISYKLTNSIGNFYRGDETMSSEVTFFQASDPSAAGINPVTKYFGFIEIPLEDNVEDNPNGEVIVQVIGGSGYVVSDSNHTVTIEVLDDDISRISITLLGPSEFTEGTKPAQEVQISSDKTRTEAFNVYYTVSQGLNDFVDNDFLGTEKFVTLPVGDATVAANLLVGIINDETPESSGIVIVNLRLDPSDSTSYTINPDRAFVRFEVIDDEPIGGRISMRVDNAEVVEGSSGQTENMVFVVTISRSAPAGGISYTWSTADDSAKASEGDYLEVRNQDGLVPAGKVEDRFTVRVNGDENVELDEIFTVTIISTTPGDIVTIRNGTATGTIKNDDVPSNVPNQDLPEVSISADTDSIVEGEAAQFTVESDSTVDSDLRVLILTTVSGDFLPFNVPTGVTLTAGTNSATFTVETTADAHSADAGQIGVSIGSSRSYSINNQKMSDSIEILNNALLVAPTERFSVAASVITSIFERVTVSQTQKSEGLPTESPHGNAVSTPAISIIAVATSVDEGSIARFEIRVDPAASSALSVEIHVDDAANRISGYHANQKQVAISSGVSAVPLEFPTENDDHAGPDSLISVSILDGIGYEVNGSQYSAQVNVSDNKDRELRSSRSVEASQESLPYLFGMVNLESLGETNRRLHAAFAADGNSSMAIAGQSTIGGILQTGMEVLDRDALSKRELYWDDSEFSIAVGPDYFGSSMATVWGAGNYNLVAEHGRQYVHRTNAGILTRQLGIDARLSEGTVAGLTAFVSEADSEIESNHIAELKFDAETTGVHSYLGWKSRNGNFQIDVISGFGANHLAMEEPGYARESLDNKFYTVFADGETTLVSLNRGGYFDHT